MTFTCPITGDEVDESEDHHLRVYDETKTFAEEFAGRVGNERVENYFIENWPVGAYVAYAFNSPHSSEEDWDVRDVFSITARDKGRELKPEQPQSVFAELDQLVDDKNDDYGNSWQKVSAIKRLMADVEGPQIIECDGDEYVYLANTPQPQNQFEQEIDDLMARLLDKVVRAYNLALIADESKLEDEGLEDALMDIAGYAGMGVDCVREHRDG